MFYTVKALVSKAESKIYKSGRKLYMYVPKSIVNDSTFPLDIDKNVTIRIEGKHLIVEQ